MIREPYNINPYNSTIDTSKVNNFGFTFSGDELGSWKVEIAKNNTSPDIVYTSKEFVPSDVGYEHIYDGDRVEGMTLPSTIAHNQEDDGLLRRLYDIVGYPYNASVVRLAVNDINDLGKIKGSTSDGYLVATTYSLGRENENVTILGYDENGVAIGSEVTNGTYNFLGYLLTVKANSDIQPGQKVQIEGNTFTIGDIEDTQDGYYELMIANGTGSFSGDAAIVTFDTLASADLTELKVKLTPIQDLNGYDSPWPGGAGKNKLQLPQWSEIASAPTVVSYADFPIKVKASTDYYLSTTFFNGYNPVGKSMYVLIANSPTDNANWKAVAHNTNGKNDGVIRSSTDGYLYLRINPPAVAQATYEELYNNVQTMLEEGSSVTSYAPYSNICPICPSNGVNLIDADTVWSAYRQDDGTFVNPLGTTHYSIPQSLVGKELTFSAKAKANSSSANCRVSASIGGSTKNGNLVNTTDGFTLTTLTITPTSTSDYLVLQSSGANGTYKEIQLELGSTATPYVPYQGINVEQRGTNWWSGETEEGTIHSGTGANLSDGTRFRSVYLIPIFPSTSYYAYCGTEYTSGRVGYYDKDGKYISTSWAVLPTNGEFTTPANAHYMRFTYVGTYNNDISINYPSTDHDYHAYNGTTYPLSLGQNVYGGTLDVVSGKLTIEYAKYTISNFSGTFGAVTNGYCVYIVNNTTTHDTTKVDATFMKSNMFTYSPEGRTVSPLWSYGLNSGGDTTQSFILPSTITSLAEANTWLSNLTTPIECTFRLATPTEVDLTPTQISTLLGENNIWSSGNILNITFSYEES